MTLKKQKDPQPQELRVKIKHRKEEQKVQEADKEIKDYLSNRKPKKS